MLSVILQVLFSSLGHTQTFLNWSKACGWGQLVGTQDGGLSRGVDARQCSNVSGNLEPNCKISVTALKSQKQQSQHQYSYSVSPCQDPLPRPKYNIPTQRGSFPYPIHISIVYQLQLGSVISITLTEDGHFSPRDTYVGFKGTRLLSSSIPFVKQSAI